MFDLALLVAINEMTRIQLFTDVCFIRFLKRATSFEEQKDICPAHPVGSSLTIPLGLPSSQSKPGAQDPLPCCTSLPWCQCLGLCISPGPSYTSLLCQQWARQILSRYMGMQTPPWTQTSPQTLWSLVSLLMYALNLAEKCLMYFPPFTQAPVWVFPQPF